VLTLAPQWRSCAASPGVDLITLTFGASDTVMQMQLNADKVLTLERCPAPPNP
jgi:hypothetical protein